MPKKTTTRLIVKNKKAYHDYEVLDKFEAGIELLGYEVKSIREGDINLKGSFVDIHGGEAWTNNIHISKYKFANIKDYDPVRKRKLLLRKGEIEKIAISLNTKGVTAIPLEIYKKGGLLKVLVGICRGKKKYEKRFPCPFISFSHKPSSMSRG